MNNKVFLETFTTIEDYDSTKTVKLPLESLITYCVHRYCDSLSVLNLVHKNSEKEKFGVILEMCDLNYSKDNDIPWQVSSCIYPVVMYEDTIITGLCGVVRHIVKYRTSPQSPQEHEAGLLGFRKSCLQAPNEASIWTKFCEIDIIRTVIEVLIKNKLKEVPANLVRFENHLKKPVRVHNVYKMARDLMKGDGNITENVIKEKKNTDKTRVVKSRKWKSNKKKDLEIDCSVKIEDLNINHQFAEGPFFTLADLVLWPSYHIIIKAFGNNFQSLLPLTYNWYNYIMNLCELNTFSNILKNVNTKEIIITDIIKPTVDDVSLYKCDPKRHNPKKRLFTKEDDIVNALNSLSDGMEMEINNRVLNTNIDWNNIPDGANPLAGHLPDDRMVRKSQQLENLALAVMNIAKEGDLIVDFCSGSGHLGILLAHLLPKCTIILLENKEQSLQRARNRVHELDLKNVYFFQCNLDFFIGKFEIGIALHACGIASDLVMDKCLKANAKFIICPCCYGSLHITDRFIYPRSERFKDITIDQYLCIGHAADQTHEDHPLTARGARCMAAIDSDRGRLAEQFGYKVTLSRLKPLSCTPKNNLLIGVP
ncbi:hypothetical protein K1T71_009865 [Dendrolimus kikuchii]|uniref:Uncharacterized protein n=1 Tax=Dendrolimus kikuchii TaxID=765133 RepID=A0ACC1CTZ5_9NEOP|nr:hypothetical protein K1T71_009865 [Dendrolimus kikuchii]